MTENENKSVEIAEVNATTHKIPIEVPLLDKSRERLVVFTEVRTDSGIVGYGLTGKRQWFAVRELINKEIAPILKSKSALRTEQIWHELQQELNPRVQTGVWSSAVSSIDIALWDIKGKYLEEPVWKLLGGAQNPVPAYITFGLKGYDKEQLAEVANDFASQGEDKLKMKVGINDATDPNEDAVRVAAVREAIGPDVELMIDANYEFSINTALELCNRLESYDITWFEEPVYGNDVNLLTNLRKRTTIPLAAGQNEGYRSRHRELISRGAIDISQPNVCYGGGYTEGRKVASLAQSFNLRIANGGGWPHHNMHLHAGMPNGWRVEFHYVMWKLGDMIYQDPPVPQQGKVTVPDEPGLGLEPKRDVLDEYCVD
jgi:L-rhamnonate dehydratase